MSTQPANRVLLLVILLIFIAGAAAAAWGLWPRPTQKEHHDAQPQVRLNYLPRQKIDPSGVSTLAASLTPWPPDATLEEIARHWDRLGYKYLERIEADLKDPDKAASFRIILLMNKAGVLNYEGEPERALAALAEARTLTDEDPALAEQFLYSILYFQGVTSLRRGETENCIMCRGESSCILPIVPAAQHTNQTGSRDAIKHFMAYLEQFPDDLEVKWLMNIAHMTLGQYPNQVDPRFRIALDLYNHNEHSIGKFRDISHLVGLNRLNQAGGIIMDEFHNNGLLDLVFTSMDPGQPLVFYKNKGDGTFEDRTKEAGLAGQLGGLGCVQADFNNDGFMDIYIPRGAWLKYPMRPSLLRNNGNGTFTDVTREAGLLDPMNTDTCQWADFDNDGYLDLFVCNESGPCKLYRNKGDGTFEDVAAKAGLGNLLGMWKGCTWLDYDNDGYPDLFLNSNSHTARLFHNNRDGTFTDVTAAMGIDGPVQGLSCWSWDYDNDGWPDIFATCYDRSLGDVVKGLIGEPHGRHTCKLYRNLGGKKFQDVTREVGLDGCYSAMGTNFGDFDNDGFLDFYLGTGDHDIATLVPNRMFRNLGGKKFVDISASSGTGHLQKGHGVACGDWCRSGNIHIAIQMGGTLPGDRFHNILFQNPGQGNNWINLKLVGKKTNRCAIGARIKVVTEGEKPLTVFRTVCSGSSFGANPLEQLIGVGKAGKIARLEIFWPTSKTTQVFTDVAVNQALEITESEPRYQQRPYKAITPPK